MPRVVESLRTVGSHCECAAGLRCAGPDLQPACPHVLQTSFLSGSVLEDTRACFNGDHDDRASRRYLFTLIARNPWGTWRSRSCPMPGDESRGHGTRDGSGAVVGSSGGSWSHEARDNSRVPVLEDRSRETRGHMHPSYFSSLT
jgi:hypothetical protein